MSPDSIGYQTFGRKAYWLSLSKWLQTPFAFLVAAFALSIAGRSGYIPVEYKRIAATGTLFCLAIAIISALICVLLSRIVFRSQQFNLSNDSFKLAQGVFRKHEIAIPYHQIQNVNIERTLYQQMTGVSKLVIETAGNDASGTADDEGSAVLRDIDRDVAIALQDELLRRADVVRIAPSAPVTPAPTSPTI